MYFADGAKNLIRDWLTMWRPIFARRSGSDLPPSDQEPLFIDRSGKQVENWSRVISLLWERTFDREMNSTILRYWKATMVALRAESEEERRLVYEADCHGVQVTKKFYCKVFSLMDAKKAKDRTDLLCSLQMSESWSRLEAVSTFNLAGDNSSGDDSEESEESGESDEEGKRPKAKTGRVKGRRPLIIRGGLWCEADELLLIRAYTAAIPNAYGKWVGILEAIKHQLQVPNRTAENLRDKYRNLLKFKPDLVSAEPQKRN
jgi:hypothetical protein